VEGALVSPKKAEMPEAEAVLVATVNRSLRSLPAPIIPSWLGLVAFPLAIVPQVVARPALAPSLRLQAAGPVKIKTLPVD